MDIYLRVIDDTSKPYTTPIDTFKDSLAIQYIHLIHGLLDQEVNLYKLQISSSVSYLYYKNFIVEIELVIRNNNVVCENIPIKFTIAEVLYMIRNNLDVETLTITIPKDINKYLNKFDLNINDDGNILL